MFIFLGVVCCIAAFVCSIMILIDAFQNEIWKGLLCLVCGFYSLYYALVEYDAENKWLIVGISLLGGVLGGVFLGMGGAMGHAAAPLGH